MIRNILIITFLVSTVVGIKIIYDDYSRIKYVNYSDTNFFPTREKLLYDKKYEAIENGNLFVEDMWYLMMMNASKTNKLMKQSDYFEYKDPSLEFDAIENISNEITTKKDQEIYGCSYAKIFSCDFIIDNDEMEQLLFYKGKIIHINDGKIVKPRNEEKENEIGDRITKETNILFRKYINSTYGCEYQVDCKNLKEENK